MEELSELNDIILNKSGLRSSRRKWLIIIFLLTLILVAIVVGMRSLKSDDVQKVLQSVLPPEPNAPTEVINDPIVDPVKTSERNATTTVIPMDTQPKETIEAAPEEIPSIGEKPVTPSAPKEVLEETPTKTIIQPAPVAKAPEKKSDVEKKVLQPAPVVEKKIPTVVEKPKKESPKKEPSKKEEPKKEPKPVAQPKKVTPEMKTPAPVKKVSDAKPAEKVTSSNGDTTTYYIQVGSFSKEPNPALLDHLNASGLHYTTRKVGDMTKLLVGPYQGEQAAKEGLANVRQNVEAQAFRVK